MHANMKAFGEHEGDKSDGKEKSSRSLPTTVQIGLGVSHDRDGLSQTVQHKPGYPGGILHGGLGWWKVEIDSAQCGENKLLYRKEGRSSGLANHLEPAAAANRNKEGWHMMGSWQ